MPAVLVRTEGLAVTSSTDTTVPAYQDSADLTARQVKSQHARVCSFCIFHTETIICNIDLHSSLCRHTPIYYIINKWALTSYT